MVIKISPSPTGDTRTCDPALVSYDELARASISHIGDVSRALTFFALKLLGATRHHDADKLTELAHFHSDFVTGFEQTGWWDEHRRISRHHLTKSDGVPQDVNLCDVIEFLSDCIMAGMARSGEVYALKLPDGLLDRAFANTVDLLLDNVEVVK